MWLANAWLTRRGVNPRRDLIANVELFVAFVLLAFGLGYCVWRG